MDEHNYRDFPDPQPEPHRLTISGSNTRFYDHEFLSVLKSIRLILLFLCFFSGFAFFTWFCISFTQTAASGKANTTYIYGNGSQTEGASPSADLHIDVPEEPETFAENSNRWVDDDPDYDTPGPALQDGAEDPGVSYPSAFEALPSYHGPSGITVDPDGSLWTSDPAFAEPSQNGSASESSLSSNGLPSSSFDAASFDGQEPSEVLFGSHAVSGNVGHILSENSAAAFSKQDTVSWDGTVDAAFTEDRLYLGVIGLDVALQDAITYGFPRGFLIDQIQPESGAEKAGLTAGMVIVGIDGIVVTGVKDLRAILDLHQPGDVVQISVVDLGDGSSATIPVQIIQFVN